MLPITILLKPVYSMLNKKRKSIFIYLLLVIFLISSFKYVMRFLKNFSNFSRHDILAHFDIHTSRECLSFWGVMLRTQKIFFSLIVCSFSFLVENIFIQYSFVILLTPHTPHKYSHFPNPSNSMPFSLFIKKT